MDFRTKNETLKNIFYYKCLKRKNVIQQFCFICLTEFEFNFFFGKIGILRMKKRGVIISRGESVYAYYIYIIKNKGKTWEIRRRKAIGSLWDSQLWFT